MGTRGIKKEKRKKLPIEEKETYRWLQSLEATKQAISEDTHIITITDREGDIFELFALERPRNMDLLIRAVQNRRVKVDDSEIGKLRNTPDAPCEVVFQTHEWQALHAFTYKKNALPTIPPSLREATRLVAKLGGFLARKSDGKPGVQTIWRGLRRLDDLASMWLLLHSPPS